MTQDTRLRNDDGELMYVRDRDQICQATFKEHCQYPKCDCDHPVTAAVINSTEFPRDKRLSEYYRLTTPERLIDLEAKLAGEYVGGMTEFWQRQKDFLLSQKGQEVADVLDGPDQECYPLEGPWYPRPEPNDPNVDIEHPKECRCEVCRYWGA